jgi:hypothetical protein
MWGFLFNPILRVGVNIQLPQVNEVDRVQFVSSIGVINSSIFSAISARTVRSATGHQLRQHLSFNLSKFTRLGYHCEWYKYWGQIQRWRGNNDSNKG